jgi:GTP cyclohydrolase II
VLLHGNGHVLVIAAAETVGAAGLAEIAAHAADSPVLLVAPTRAAALARVVGVPGSPDVVPLPTVSPDAAAFRLPAALLDPATLRGLADPTAGLDLPQMPHAVRDVSPLAAAALALAKLARLLPAVVAASAREASETELLAVAAADVLGYPAGAAASLRPVAEAAVPLDGAPDARLVAFRAADGGVEHVAILVGRPDDAARADRRAPLVRLHSECFTGDLLGSLRCDCGPQLRGAIKRMAEEGAGVLLYLAQEGRGIGLVNKLRAYRLQDGGLDTLDANRALGWGADERTFLVAAAMLEQLGVTRVRLLTNNPEKLAGLAAAGIHVDGREALSFAPNGVNDGYLETKARRFGHLLG